VLKNSKNIVFKNRKNIVLKIGLKILRLKNFSRVKEFSGLQDATLLIRKN